MIAAVIVACEVGFWLVLAAGLVVRYPLRRPRLGGVVLLGTPLLDVILLVVTAVDLRRGAEVTGAHTLAAVYLGFSVAFGPSLVRWADVRFAHRFAGGPPPRPRPAARSVARRRAVWVEWMRVVLAAVIASVVLGGLWLLADEDQRRTLVLSTGPIWIVVAGWFVFGPLWDGLPTRNEPAAPPSAAHPHDATASAAGGHMRDDGR